HGFGAVTSSSRPATLSIRNEPGGLAMRAITVLAFVPISSTSFAATSERFGRGWLVPGFPAGDRARQRQWRTVSHQGPLPVELHVVSGLAQCLRRAQRDAVVPRRS